MNKNECDYAAILVGFGSPSGPSDVRPFLYRIFSDPLASPFSRLGPLKSAAASLLAAVAAPRSKKRYKAVAMNENPAREVSRLVECVQERFDEEMDQRVRIFYAMRYGSPGLSRVLPLVSATGAKQIAIVSLYPQRAVATHGSMEAEVGRIRKSLPCEWPDISFCGAWHRAGGLVAAWTGSIMSAMSEFPEGERSRIHLIFSAHAVPVRHIEQFGDDYVVHVRESAKLIGGALGGKFSASIAYQSKAPSGKWTGPALKEELHRLGKSGVDNCIIIPISFIHDSVETWCDIDMSILPNARKFGMRKICRARPPIDSDGVVDALVETITQVLSLKRGESG